MMIYECWCPNCNLNEFYEGDMDPKYRWCPNCGKDINLYKYLEDK
jgi:uncharacterized protein (DUF983 family)